MNTAGTRMGNRFLFLSPESDEIFLVISFYGLCIVRSNIKKSVLNHHYPTKVQRILG